MLKHCPSQPQEPIILTQSPDWTFQLIIMDLFNSGDRAYLACADKLTFWLILYCQEPGHATKSKLTFICQQLFQTYGTVWSPPDNSFGLTPSESMIKAILNFPVPRTITDTRSWFRLINPVAWAYSLGQVMLSFWDLVKQNSKFSWNQNLEDTFKDSKRVLFDLVQKAVAMFDKDQVTCLAPNWSKKGMGFLLQQKRCQCTIEKAPICCPKGWHLIFDGSRFFTEAECRYAPIED